MVRQVKAFAAKLDDLKSVPKTHKMEGADSCRLCDPVGPTRWKESPAGYL